MTRSFPAKNSLFISYLVLIALFSLVAAPGLRAQGGVMPKTLIVPDSPEAAAQISVDGGDQVSATPSPGGIDVAIKAGDAGYPGITLKPANAPSWDLGLYGHVEVKVTNTGNKTLDLNLRVDNDGDYHASPWNAESKKIDPGQTKTLRVYFGYSYGFHPAFKLNPQAVTALHIFTGKTGDDLSFRVAGVQGAGWVGEKIGVDPDRVAIKPPGGLLLDPSQPIAAGAQIGMTNGAKGSLAADGKSLEINFDGDKQQAVTFHPATGLWNLNEALEVKVRVKNTGSTPMTPSVRLESEAGPGNIIAALTPLAPGEETEITAPFAAQTPWVGEVDPRQEDPKVKENWRNQTGTGTLYCSQLTTGITLLSDTTPGAKALQVTSMIADLPPPAVLPDWLGKKPPVDGDWVQTLDENFDGDSLDFHRWNVHGPNYWDKRMHFSKDQAIVKDGLLALRLEKKPGYNNDDPTGKIRYSGALTDYATVQPDTFGKWTQRYGYFEIREKQSTAKSLWPGFWMMPDRGLKSGLGEHERGDTSDGGMEFDVTESQSAWGAYRFNIACHWDGYQSGHKTIGTSCNYVQADKDGFIVVGLLWTPGSYVVYGNGKEIFRWESPRVSHQEAFLILQNELGGWDNEPVDDTELPADFVVDYMRVWQRKDLAMPDDGPKPNKGDFDAYHESLGGTATSPAP